MATNAGGPHALKYGVTGAWVAGLEAVLAPGELVQVGGWAGKDVAGYDLKSLLIGSEGTLGVITAVRLRLLPAPEAAIPLVVFLRTRDEGCAAIGEVFAAGLRPSVLDFLDGETLRDARGRLSRARRRRRGGLRADRARWTARARRPRPSARRCWSCSSRPAGRGGDGGARAGGRAGAVALARRGQSGGDGGARGEGERGRGRSRWSGWRRGWSASSRSPTDHGLRSCAWGHGGDGNVHATVLVDPAREAELDAAEAVGEELFALVVELGGSIAGEHGVGWLKRGRLESQWDRRALELHEQIKRAFDPKGLLNPGTKLARYPARSPGTST